MIYSLRCSFILIFSASASTTLMLFDTDQPELTQAAMSINSAINQHLFTHNDVKEVNSILSKTLSKLKKHQNLLATLNEYHQSNSKEQA